VLFTSETLQLKPQKIKMEIKSSGCSRSHQDKLLKSFQSFSTIVRRTTISTTTIVRKTLTKLPAAFLGNFSNLGGGGEGLVEGKDVFEKNEETSHCCKSSPSPPMRPPKPHPGQKVRETPLGMRRRVLRPHHHHHHHHHQGKRRKPRLVTPPDSPDWVVHFPAKEAFEGKAPIKEEEELPFKCAPSHLLKYESDSKLKYNLSPEGVLASTLILPLTSSTPGEGGQSVQTWCRNVSGGPKSFVVSGLRAEESDDSGRGTCEHSDASDVNNFSDFGNNCEQSDFSDGSPRLMENRRKTSKSGSLSLKRTSCPIFSQKGSNWSQKGLDAKISVLNGERCSLDRELEVVCQRLEEIEGALAKVGTYGEVKKLQSYVANSEKTTLLLHGIARRIARMESREAMMMEDRVMEEEAAKMERLSSQLEDAKEISSMVNRRLPGVLDSLEARIGEERRREFLECLDRRTQVLVIRKELEDKIEMEERLGFLTVL